MGASTDDRRTTAPRARDRRAALDRRRERELGRRERRPRARGRAHGARRDQRRDVGGDQRLPPRARRRLGRRHRLRRPVLVRRLREEPLGAVLGRRRRARCCATRRTRSSTRAGASSPPTWCCGCSASRCPSPGETRSGSRATGRRSRCSARSAACRRSAAPAPRRRRADGGGALPALYAQLPRLGGRVDRRRARRARARRRESRAPPSPVLRLSRVLADLDFRARAADGGASELLEVCEIVGSRARAGRRRHHRPILWGGHAPEPRDLMHFAIHYVTEYRYARAGDRQPQRVARAPRDDDDAALRRVPRSHRSGVAARPPRRLLRHRGDRVRYLAARTAR